ncbi:MAG: 50S ribosomal protein L15 [Gammaproteobacteria bacterium]|nr:50S ribosomal protein L15 [Gammaproteobacteria bacterium]
MRLNTLKPAAGSKPSPKRLGRGIGSGLGKTSGKGHKGQHARAGGYHKVGFEGGQMPIQRRMPKVGFNSAIARVTAEVRLSELNLVAGDVVDMASLLAADVLSAKFERAKIIASGTVDRAFTVRGLRVTKGAKAAIEAAGGKIEG